MNCLRNHGWPLLVLALACALGGCRHDSKTYGKVSGRVTSENKPVVEAVVLFQEPAQHIYIQAVTDADGRYNFSDQPGEGLPIGHYQIAVLPPTQEIHTGQPLPPPKPFPKVKPTVHDPARSGFQLEVVAGENHYDLDLSLAK